MSGRRKRGDPSARALVLAFVAVTVAFVASTGVAEYSDLEIRRAASQITGNAAPSIEHLAQFRGELRRFTLLADDEVDRGTDHLPPGSWAKLERPLDAAEQAWTRYRALPTFAAERQLSRGADQAKALVDSAARNLRGQMERGEWRGARTTLERNLKPAIDAVDALALQIIDVDARNGAALAARIDGLGRRSIVRAVVLDALSVALTILAAVMVVRIVRRYTSLLEQRAEELELFAGRVAHDVLGPLGAASLALDAAERDPGANPRTLRVVASGRAGLRRARSIADGLLEFARAGARPGPDARADVMEVVRAVVDEVEHAAQERGITVQVEAIAPGEVACGAGVLTSVVSNLVRNAVKYIGEGPRRRVTIRVRPVGPRVRIEIEDNGHGLPPELGDQVFEPYVRGAGSREPGIGLGLATVKKIVEAHGGRVDVRSVPGLGARFGVELPAREPPPQPRSRTRRDGGDRDRAVAEKEAIDRPLQAQ